jgi:hypothetical protein
VCAGGPNYFAVSRRLVDESGASSTASGYRAGASERSGGGVQGVHLNPLVLFLQRLASP